MGRKLGSQNKVSSVARLKLAKLKCDPIEASVRCANELYKEGHLREAGNMYLELIGYIVPKLKAVEHSQDSENPVSFNITLGGQ